MKRRSYSNKISKLNQPSKITELDLIDSLKPDFKTVKAEERKTIKLKFANKLAKYFTIGYFVLLFIYIFIW